MTGDPRAFKQIVLNLVANAIKFTERGGTVTVSAAVEGSRLMLRVRITASASRPTTSSGSAIPSSRPARPISGGTKAPASDCRS